MSVFAKIITVIFFFQALLLSAQNENLHSFSNRVLLNPSFAGYDKNANLWNGLQFFSKSKEETVNRFSLTYDSYSEKLNGGIAFYVEQGLNGITNTNNTELGFSYAGFRFDIGKTKIISSINTNLGIGTKQWFVHFIDYLLDKEIEPPSTPGNKLTRYYQLKPRIGFLADLPGSYVGISAMYILNKNVATEGYLEEHHPMQFLLYYAKKLKGKKKGLVSKSFKAYPELILFYSDTSIVSRVSIKAEHSDHTIGAFIQNDYFANVHTIGGTYGWRKNNLRINLTAGTGVSFVSDKMVIQGEITLGYSIPAIYYSKRNPWATRKKKL